MKKYLFFSICLTIFLCTSFSAMHRDDYEVLYSSGNSMFEYSSSWIEDDEESILDCLKGSKTLMQLVNKLDKFLYNNEEYKYLLIVDKDPDNLMNQIINKFLGRYQNNYDQDFEHNIIDQLVEIIKNIGSNRLVERILSCLKYYYQIDINKTKNSKENLVLIQAIYDKDIELLKKLLSLSNINMNIKSIDGDNPLIFALKLYGRSFKDRDVFKIVEILSNNKIINICSGGYTPLGLIAYYGNMQLFNLIIYKQADINMSDNNGNTPLIILAKYGHKKILEELLRYSDILKINAQNKDGYTALMMAAYYNNFKVAKKLILYKANLNIQDQSKNTALTYAIFFKNDDIANLLLDNQADVNVQNIKGETPLIMAIKNNNLNLVKKIIDNGAKLNFKDTEGLDALDWAHKMDLNDISELLQSK
ncbi:ankyrin repeat domain-containing protein [Candidatus Babela massiliensis]|uniref:Ankyrin repeats containing protein n=1 Tax=Candidatus Babela massiliensis TaxID=673862 RepID=V6DHM6_9BACT|nr:ankyrin repeat domain-containing protein [Candidatus Babela massiliensis]CDK31050.1 Ankyrin repeats containing protein [Candidatus Babela massiliensis]